LTSKKSFQKHKDVKIGSKYYYDRVVLSVQESFTPYKSVRFAGDRRSDFAF